MTTPVLDASPLFQAPPCDWWLYVPCGYCGALRQEPCLRVGVFAGMEAKRPHASRYRDGLTLHHTLWLLGNFPNDVLGAGVPRP